MSFFDDIQRVVDNLGFVDREVTSADAEESTAPIAGKEEYEWYQQQTYVPADRKQRIGEYEDMDTYPELASALDIYADDGTQENEHGNRLKIYSEDEDIEEELKDLFYNTININHHAWAIFRTTCKYGDGWYELILNKDKNAIVGIKHLPQKTMFRVEENGKLRGFIQEIPQGQPVKFAPFEIVHFRLATTNSSFAPYGTSVLEPARRVWRQLKLMEDAMVVYRVTRAPERRVFKMDVGNLPPSKAEQFVERQRQKFRKRSFVNQRTGQMDYRANSIAPDEDFWIPVRAGTEGTNIETLPGASNLDEIADVKYFKDKIFAALKIPRIFLQDIEGGTEGNRQNLSHQDIRFARTIERIQSQIEEGFKKIAIVHLILRGYKKKDLDNFTVTLTPPSNLNEQMEAELIQTVVGAAESMYSFGFPKVYLAQRFFGITEDEWKNLFYIWQAEQTAIEGGQGGDPYQNMQNGKMPPQPPMAQPGMEGEQGMEGEAPTEGEVPAEGNNEAPAGQQPQAADFEIRSLAEIKTSMRGREHAKSQNLYAKLLTEGELDQKRNHKAVSDKVRYIIEHRELKK